MKGNREKQRKTQFKFSTLEALNLPFKITTFIICNLHTSIKQIENSNHHERKVSNYSAKLP